MNRFPLTDLWLSMCKEFSVYGTISSVVFQNIVITAVLKTRFPPPDLCLYKCKELEFILRFEAFYGNDNEKRKHIHH